jgi:hypothetical protein
LLATAMVPIMAASEIPPASSFLVVFTSFLQLPGQLTSDANHCSPDEQPPSGKTRQTAHRSVAPTNGHSHQVYAVDQHL